jgi:hypothetical protein
LSSPASCILHSGRSGVLHRLLKCGAYPGSPGRQPFPLGRRANESVRLMHNWPALVAQSGDRRQNMPRYLHIQSAMASSRGSHAWQLLHFTQARLDVTGSVVVTTTWPSFFPCGIRLPCSCAACLKPQVSSNSDGIALTTRAFPRPLGVGPSELIGCLTLAYKIPRLLTLILCMLSS